MALQIRSKSLEENLRMQQIYNTLWKYGLDIAFDKGTFGEFRDFLQGKFYPTEREIINLDTPTKVRLLLEELGPTYVKMGQMVSSRADVLPDDWQLELKKLQSEVPPFPVEEAREIIKTELGDYPEALFKEFTPKPIAAASTAQVHRATLLSGEKVVVKVQRPNILKQVEADLGIMYRLAALFERKFDWASNYDLQGILKEFSTNILEELDYTGEAYNTLKLADNMASIEGLKIPKIYTNFSTTRVLTIEFIDGFKVNKIDENKELKLDRVELANVALRAMMKQLMVDGFFHADPHPGNIYILPSTGELVLLDMGMMGYLTKQQRISLIQLIAAIYNKNSFQFAQVMVSLSKKFKKLNEDEFYRELDRKLSRYFGESSTGGFSDIVSSTLSVMYKHGLRLDSQLTLAIKAIAQAEEAARTLNAQMNLMETAFNDVKELLVLEVNFDNMKDVLKVEVAKSLQEVLQRAPSLHSATKKWIKQYETGKLTIHLNTDDLTDKLQSFKPIFRQFTAAIMLAGMIVGSSIATIITPNVGWDVIPRIAQAGYVGSMIIASFMTLNILWGLVKKSDEKVKDRDFED